MAEENLKFIQMKNGEGVNIFPITKQEAVQGLGASLKDLQDQITEIVNVGGEVNVIETVKLNGTALTVSDQTVNVNAVTSVKVGKGEGEESVVVAEDGVVNLSDVVYSKDEANTAISTAIGEAIADRYHMHVEILEELPATATEADLGRIVLVAATVGVGVAGEYIEYIAVKDGATYKWEQIGTTAIDLTNYATHKNVEDSIKVVTNAAALLEGRVSDLEDSDAMNSGITATKVGAYDTHIGNGDIHVTTDDKSKWDGKQDALSEAQLDAVNSNITAAKVEAYDSFIAEADGKYADISYEGTVDQHITNTDLHVTADKQAEWSAKQDALSTEQLNAIADVSKKADATVEVDGASLSVLYYEPAKFDADGNIVFPEA